MAALGDVVICHFLLARVTAHDWQEVQDRLRLVLAVQ
jgi:hypothetical protein